MSQHPSVIIRTALKNKLENYTVPYNEEHWLQMENIIIAQPKSVVIKTPTLALQIFYLALLLTTILCIIFCPVKQYVAPPVKTYKASNFALQKEKNKRNLHFSAGNYKAFVPKDTLSNTISVQSY